MRLTPTTDLSQRAPSSAAAWPPVGWRFGSSLGLLGTAAVLVVTLGSVGEVRADSRGACVETSATSAPTAAPLALDAERAAWVAGQHARQADGRFAHMPGRTGNPAWCEAGDGPECERGDQAPTRNEHASSSDAGALLPVGVPTELPLALSRPAHPRGRPGHGAAGTRDELERPPRAR